jgi:hypothetical protein
LPAWADWQDVEVRWNRRFFMRPVPVPDLSVIQVGDMALVLTTLRVAAPKPTKRLQELEEKNLSLGINA